LKKLATKKRRSLITESGGVLDDLGVL